MGTANFTDDGAGLLVVRYAVNDDLLPERQDTLIDALRTSAAKRRTGVVFVLAAGIARVDVSVPTFWLKITGDMPLAGMAIVTPSRAVRVAASGFRLANTVRGVKLPVETSTDETAATAWLKQQLATGP